MLNTTKNMEIALASVAPVFQPQIYRVQNRGTFLLTIISENIGEKSVKFHFHARMLSSEIAQPLKSYGHFSDLGVEIALSHRHVRFFG